MNDALPIALVTGNLDTQSDEALRDLIKRAEKILGDRKLQGQKEALAQIKRLIKEKKLDVDLVKKPKPRGRPPKKDGPASSE